MDNPSLLDPDGSRRALQQLVAAGGAPAFAVRAQRTHEAFEALVAVCRRKRAEYLTLARLRLGTLQALAGTWAALQPLLKDETQLRILDDLCAELRPELRTPPQPSSSNRVLRRALAELIASLEHFNRRWQNYLADLDLSRVNDLRDGYNKYYVLEKECLLGSPRLARQSFRPLPPVTTADLATLLPPLPIPALR